MRPSIRGCGMDDRAWRVLRRHRSATAGFAILALFVALSIAVPWVSPHDPGAQNADVSLQAPSISNWFGTDRFGRDIFTRVWLGGRLSLWIGVLAVALSLGAGVPLGAAAGYFGGRTDWLISRLIEIMLALPSILLALMIAAAFRGGTNWVTVVIAVGVVGIPQFARQVRAGVIEIRERDFVTAARALGASPLSVLARHVLPNTLGTIIVLSTMRLAIAILDAAALSFLGLGVETGTAEWGAMLHDGREIFRQAPYLALFSGAAITLTVLGVNLFGDGLRDALDPRSR